MSDTSIPASGRRDGTLAGTILVRIVVPLWVLAGASVKFGTFNPALLPEPILDLVKITAGPFGVRDLGWWLEMWLRFFIGAEFAAALVMFLSPKLARFTASFLLAVFLAVLAATMAKSAQREGITAIWSGSCGCFGSASPPPIAMFGIDAALLAGVVFLRPRRGAIVPLRPWLVAASVVVGFGISYGRPTPVIKLEPMPTPVPAQPSSPAPVDGGASASAAGSWGEIPDRLEPFYFTEFSEWIGRPLSSQPIARLVSRPLPDWVDEDRFHLVFYRSDCDKCHELLDAFFSGPLETPVLAVEIPDGDPAAALGMPCEECLLHRLPEGTEYVLTTPVLLTVENGIVLAACEDSDDHALVSSTIAATP